MTIRVVVADDHPLILDGLERGFAQPGGQQGIPDRAAVEKMLISCPD